MLKGRLNVFQMSMLRWREAHPYSAVHAIRIETPLDRERVETAIHAHLTESGLTGLVLDSARGRYEYTGGAATSPLRIVQGSSVAGATQAAAKGTAAAESSVGNEETTGSRANAALSIVYAEIERELNLPFAHGQRIDPFRFFAVDAGDAFHLGVAYDHWIAGGDSIVGLLKGILERYIGASAAGVPRAPLALYPPTYRRLIARHPWRVLQGTRRFWELPASCRRAFRPRYPGGHDQRNAFACLRVEAPEAERFANAAKAWGVTQNDLLIAIVMQALSAFTGERRGQRRRNELAIASIINLRRDFENTAATTFGQFLSSFRVSHRVPPGIGLQHLAKDVHSASARIRGERSYFQTLLAMRLSGAVWPFLDPEQRANLHCKNYPVWAGTTPLNVDPLWLEAPGTSPVPEYLRGVSTGPLSPLIVAATTARNVLHIGLSYRTAAFSGENTDKIIEQIKQTLYNLPYESVSH